MILNFGWNDSGFWWNDSEFWWNDSDFLGIFRNESFPKNSESFQVERFRSFHTSPPKNMCDGVKKVRNRLSSTSCVDPANKNIFRRVDINPKNSQSFPKIENENVFVLIYVIWCRKGRFWTDLVELNPSRMCFVWKKRQNNAPVSL